MNWLPVVGYEGLYEVSCFGEVRSVDQIVVGNDGTHYPKKGRVLVPHPMKNIKYLTVGLWKNNKGANCYVHRLVAQAHIPNPQNKPEVNHIDGVRTNNIVHNLEWVTSAENSQQAIQTGLKTYTNRLTREEFIECLFSVIDGESYQSLTDRVPYKVPYLSTKLRSIARELNIEGELDESLRLQRVERARINGSKNK